MAQPPPPRPPWRDQLKLRPVHKETAVQSLETRRVISDVIRRSRAPFRFSRRTTPRELQELEESLRELEGHLLERERMINSREGALMEKERDVREAEALLLAKESLIATRLQELPPRSNPAPAPSPNEQKAIQVLEQRLDEREASLEAARREIKEREAFLDDAESTLFEKTLEQQEREAELEQRAEDIQTQLDELRKLSTQLGLPLKSHLFAQEDQAKDDDSEELDRVETGAEDEMDATSVSFSKASEDAMREASDGEEHGQKPSER